MDKVKSFCDHSMTLRETTDNLPASGHFWTPPASFRVNIAFFTTFAFLGTDKNKNGQWAFLSFAVTFLTKCFFTFSSPEIYFAIFKICLLLMLPFSQLLPFWARTKTRTGSGRFRRLPSHFPQNRFPCFSCSTKRALSARLQNIIYIWTVQSDA